MDSEQLIDSPIGRSPKKHKALIRSLVVFAIIAVLVGIGYLLILKNDSDKKITSLDSQITDIKKQLNSTKSELAITKSNLEATKSSDNKTTNANVNDSTEYYSIKSWGVKFVVPNGLNVDDMTIDIISDQDAYDTKVDMAHLNTKQVQSFNDYCLGFILGTITRSKQKIDPNIGSAPMLLKSTDINGYYYYYSPSQTRCSDKSIDNAVESRHRTLLYNMAKSIDGE